MGGIGNVIAGVVGGIGGGQILGALMGAAGGDATDGMDLGSMATNLVGGGLSGIVVQQIIGIIMKNIKG